MTTPQHSDARVHAIGTANPHAHLRRIRRISRTMVVACWALIAVLPVALVWYWASTQAPDLAQQGNLKAMAIQAPLQAWQRWAAGAVSAVPLVMLLIGLWEAKRCFAQFALGQVFTVQATHSLRRFSGWVAGAALVAIIASAVISVLLTLHNPPGARHVSVGISSNQLFTLFFAALVWLMADVIGEGQALAAENDSFV